MSEVSVLTNLADSLLSVEKLVTGAAYILGILFIMKALSAMKVYGEQKSQMSSHSSMKEPVTYLLVGGMLLYFPTGFEVAMQTMFGYSDVLAYTSSSTGGALLSSLFGDSSALGQSLALLIQVIGLIAFVRGWMLVSRSASQGQNPGGMGQGLMHVVGGVLAMNIIGTLEVVKNTLYG